jgi:hypothetical protein
MRRQSAWGRGTISGVVRNNQGNSFIENPGDHCCHPVAGMSEHGDARWADARLLSEYI